MGNDIIVRLYFIFHTDVGGILTVTFIQHEKGECSVQRITSISLEKFLRVVCVGSLTFCKPSDRYRSPLLLHLITLESI